MTEHCSRLPHEERVPAPSLETEASAALYHVLDATRALLWIATPTDAALAARDLITALGGRVVPAEADTVGSLPIDVSFGSGFPSLPAATDSSPAQILLRRHLPMFVRDAQRAVELAESTVRLAEDASIDPLTRLPNRRRIRRALGRLGPENTVVMIDIDNFKAINDSAGHEGGDLVLRMFGSMLADTARASEAVGRYGGDEFIVVLAADDAGAFLDRLRSLWKVRCPGGATFSAGAATAGVNPAAAVRAADRAMYRAKQRGRDRWELATKDDYQ